MAIREAYQNKDIMEYRWINGYNNPLDLLTKRDGNRCLETLITTNKLEIRVEG